MKDEQINPEEVQSQGFFDRPAHEVVAELSERIYLYGARREDFPEGKAKIIHFATEEGKKQYKITLAEAYEEGDASRTWKGVRIQELRSLAPGEIIVFPYRAGSLPFIKTRGGANILFRELQDAETGEKITNPKQVAKTLGLNPREKGRLAILDGDHLRFERI